MTQAAAKQSAATETTYTASQVIERTGATYRSLDYWCRTQRLPVAAFGSGTYRTFTTADLATVRGVVTLTRFGIDLDRAFEIARALVAADEYRVVLADVFELVVSVRNTASSPVEKGQVSDG